MENLKGTEIIIKALINEEIDTIFGYPGGAILPFYDSLFIHNDQNSTQQINHILSRHEQGATHAAEGFARSTGKVGVITVTSGPGATNTITGLADAFLDSIPLVCISGQVATNIIGTDGFQEADITGLTRSCTKYNYLVKDVNELGYIIHEAFYIAKSGKPGPVLIDIPKDIQNKIGTYKGKITINRPSYQPQKHYFNQADLQAEDIESAIDILKNSQRPIVYIGGGVINSGQKASNLLLKFLEKTNFPFTSTLMGLGAVSTDHKNFLGMLGMHGTYEANMAMYEADVILNVGARFDDRVTGKVDQFSPNSKKIHIDIDPVSINKIIPVDVALIADITLALEKILALWPQDHYNETYNWWQKIKKWQDIKSLSYKNSDKVIKPNYALETIDEITKKYQPFISTDVGQHQMWAAQYLSFTKPKKWLTSGGLGTMGYGVPAAMGAQVANPDSLVMCISGDASFLMNLQELSTIRQYNLPVKIIIINNGYMGMVRQWQELVYGGRESQSYMDALPDFVKLGESFGIKSIRCSKPFELKEKLQQMIDHKGAVLFDLVVEKNENIFPMIPAGAAHNEILLGSEAKKYQQKDINAV